MGIGEQTKSQVEIDKLGDQKRVLINAGGQEVGMELPALIESSRIRARYDEGEERVQQVERRAAPMEAEVGQAIECGRKIVAFGEQSHGGSQRNHIYGGWWWQLGIGGGLVVTGRRRRGLLGRREGAGVGEGAWRRLPLGRDETVDTEEVVVP